MSPGSRSTCAGYRKYESHTAEMHSVSDFHDTPVFLLVWHQSQHFRKMATLAVNNSGTMLNIGDWGSLLIAVDDTGSWELRNCYPKAFFAATRQRETL